MFGLRLRVGDSTPRRPAEDASYDVVTSDTATFSLALAIDDVATYV